MNITNITIGILTAIIAIVLIIKFILKFPMNFWVEKKIQREKGKEEKFKKIKEALEEKDWETVISLTAWEPSYMSLRATTKLLKKIGSKSRIVLVD